MNLIVIKRDGQTKVDFDRNKIEKAINKAMSNGGVPNSRIARLISEEIEEDIINNGEETVTIKYIEKEVVKKLIEYGQSLTATAYERYRAVRESQRDNPVDKLITDIINASDDEKINENSNKNAYIAGTQRDLICGEVSKDYTDRMLLPPEIVLAHKEGLIHFHDKDYFVQNIHNCCLIGMDDMLQNGTVINGKMIEKPKSFKTAATVATQIVHQISNGQYGGCTFSVSHLAPFVRISYEKHKKWYTKFIVELHGYNPEDKKQYDYTYEVYKQMIDDYAEKQTKIEIKDGVQTMNYQINTFSNQNGQSAFVTAFMYISEDPEYEKETAMIIEEILNQRITGMKNSSGAVITQAFPKLIYVLDENNIPKDSKYRYLTDLSIKCVSKRMVPDFISAKIMKEHHEGNVYPCMGCRSFVTDWKDKDGNYKYYQRANLGVVSINLVDVALSANKDMNKFWKILDDRLELCHKALKIRYEKLRDHGNSDVSPIHWQYGGLARLPIHTPLKDILEDPGRFTLSLGYAGLYECTYAMLGVSHTNKEIGTPFAISVMKYMKNKCKEWTDPNCGPTYSVYGTPLESTTGRFADGIKKRFGIIKGITDKGYVTNSYHVPVTEEINPFDKLSCESIYQPYSSGGAISYIEASNLEKNLDALATVVEFIYETIQYAEINTKSDHCNTCGFNGEILMDENLNWYCPNCGERDLANMTIVRRTCGYIGSNNWSLGRRAEFVDRYVHLDNHEA